jgi:hypothetical protein
VAIKPFTSGDGTGSHGVELTVISGGDGPHCILQILLWVLLVEAEDYIVFSFLCEAHFITCEPTAPC